jgi:hypothetical protein
MGIDGLSEVSSGGYGFVPVYPGFKTRWNYLETRRCVRDSDNGNFSREELVFHSELSVTRDKWTWPNRRVRVKVRPVSFIKALRRDP